MHYTIFRIEVNHRKVKSEFFFLFSRPSGNNCWKYQADSSRWVLLHYLHQGPQRFSEKSLCGPSLVWCSLLLVLWKAAKMSKVLHVKKCLQNASEKHSSWLERSLFGHFCCQEVINLIDRILNISLMICMLYLICLSSRLPYKCWIKQDWTFQIGLFS